MFGITNFSDAYKKRLYTESQIGHPYTRPKYANMFPETAF